MEKNSIDIIIKSSLEDFEVACTPQDWAFMENMLDAEVTTPLDNTAKSQLQNMEVPFDIAAWVAMESALDDLQLVEVDDAAKSALENFETPYNPTDWSIMGAMLDAEMPDGIDEIAKTALSNYTVPFIPLDWAMMDMELDDAGFPHEMDEAAKSALNQFETTRMSDWTAMESSLVEAEDVRRQLIITKSIEVFLFVFAIWTIGNFLPFHHESANSVQNSIENVEKTNQLEHQTETHQPQASLTIDTEELSIVEDATQNNIANEVNNIEGIEEQVKSSTEVIMPSATQTITAPEHNNITSESAIEKIMKPIVEQILENPIKTTIPIEKNQSAISTETVTPKAANKPLAEGETLKDQYVSPLNKKGGIFKTKDNLKSQSIASNAMYIDKKQFALVLEDELPTTSISNKYKYKPLRLKAAVSPQSAVLSSNNNTRNIATTGFAMSLGLDYAISEKVEVSSGFTYNKKSYSFQEQEAFYSSNEPSTLNTIWDVEMDIMQVPLRVNYNIKSNKKTRLYAIGGATAGIIMKIANYSRDVSLANVALGFRSNANNDNSLAAENNGVLQNGEISTSSFITADIGLGLEYKTNRRFSFFIEPLFQRSINKIGIDDETYKNYALSMGSRIIL